MVKALQALVPLAVIALIGLVGYLLWANFKPGEPINVDPDGRTVARIVDVRLEKVSDLRVLHLTGTAQGAACVQAWKIFRPCRVFKAPAEVDYRVDLSRLSLGDFRWNEGAKTLLVDVPDVKIGSVNVDTSRVLVDRTDGVFVPRSAMADLQAQSSAAAHRVVQAEAEKPANIDRARRNGRTQIEALFAKPLQAAGLHVDVQVRFAGEPRPTSEHWDVTRSLQDVLGGPR